MTSHEGSNKRYICNQSNKSDKTLRRIYYQQWPLFPI